MLTKVHIQKNNEKKSESFINSWVRYFIRPVTIIKSYQKDDFLPDMNAGLTVSMLAFPQAIAFASIANLPPRFGLYAAITAAIVGSLWGSSKHLSTGPTNAASILMLSVLAPIIAVNSKEYLIAVSVIAILAGIFRVIFGLFGLGVLINFVSRSVILGFAAGAGVLIAVKQLHYLIKIDMPSGKNVISTFLYTILHFNETHFPTLILGLFTIILTIVIKLFLKKLPAALISLVFATGFVYLFHTEKYGIVVLGAIPYAIPKLVDLHYAWYFVLQHGGQIVIGALALALLGLVEALSISRSISRTSGQRLDVNQEFVGQGLSNIVSGFFSGYPCSGSFTRSALNYQVGARTQLAGVYTGILIFLSTALLARFLAFLPHAALSGVIIVVAYDMIDGKEIKRVIQTDFQDSIIILITFIITLIFPLEFAVISGVIFSLGIYIYQLSMPRVFPAIPDKTFRHFINGSNKPNCSQIAILKIRGSLFFGATQHVEEVLLQNLTDHPSQRNLLLLMHGVNNCDFTGIEMLESVLRTYREHNGDVFFIHVNHTVRTIMQHSGFEDNLGKDHFLSQDTAIDYLFTNVIDPAKCWYSCSEHIFAECQAITKKTIDFHLPPLHDVALAHSQFLDVEQAEKLIKTKSPMLIDVREPEEYKLGHLHQSISIPLSVLLKNIDTLPNDKPILFICRAGRRSKRIMEILFELGHKNTHNIKGGILSWKAANKPLKID